MAEAWHEDAAGPEDLVRLRELMARTEGSAAMAVALIDGPVATEHAWLQAGHIQVLPGGDGGSRVARRHGTLVAGVLHARRDSPRPGLCPGCTLLIRSVFTNATDHAPLAAVAAAIHEVIGAGARIINLSLGPEEHELGGGREPAQTRKLTEALDETARSGVLVVAAAGNQSSVGGSAVTHHPWVIPVAACDPAGRVLPSSNLGASIGTRGLAAPGEDIVSLDPAGGSARFSGSSAAVPFVTGALALLWSVCPAATAVQLRSAVAGAVRRHSVVPPLLNAETSYRALVAMHGCRPTG